MSNPIDRFKGCAKAEVKTGRIPNPALGKAAYLIDTVRMKESTKPGASGFRVEVTMSTLWGIEAGKDAKGVESGPDAQGTKVSHCIFSGDYFLKSFKELVLKCLGVEPSQELDIADSVCPTSEYPNLDELGRIEVMWEQVLPGLVCAFDPKDGSAVDSGIFDGQVIVELGTTEKEVAKLIDKSKGDVEGNYIFDGNGVKLVSTYRNTYFNRNIGKAEIREKLDEKDIARFFGSAEKFEELDD